MWLFLLGAIWRVIDGGDNAPKGWHLIPFGATPIIYYMYDWKLSCAWLIATIALLDGFKDWTDYGYMSMRYTGYAALAVALFDVSSWYILAGLVSGLCYPVGASINNKYTFSYTTFCEAIAGGLLYGVLFI